MTGNDAAGGLPVVFFVDDDDALRRLVARAVRGHFEFLGAGSVAEASEVAERYGGPIDVVLMDIFLPDGWGSVAAQRIREARPHVPVVYTTGMAETDPILSSALNDAPWVLQKPFGVEELLDVLNRAAATNPSTP